jgi:hypothetical protein
MKTRVAAEQFGLFGLSTQGVFEKVGLDDHIVSKKYTQ